MKLRTGASDSSRVPITHERLGKSKAQPLPKVWIKSNKKTLETDICTGLNRYIYQRWLVSPFEHYSIQVVAVIAKRFTSLSAAPIPANIVPRNIDLKVSAGSSSSRMSTTKRETSNPVVITGSPFWQVGLESSSKELSSMLYCDSFSSTTISITFSFEDMVQFLGGRKGDEDESDFLACL